MTNVTDELLILFTRFPVPGQVKTRLIPALGPYKAAKLQKILTAESIRQAVKLAEQRGSLAEVFFCGGDRAAMERMFTTSLPFREQRGSTLGERLAGAFEASFNRGMSRVVIVGTDCPHLDAGVMASAMQRLECSDVVVGPATDGGFYLIGLGIWHKPILEGIDWGTEKAYDHLLTNIEKKGLRLDVMEYLSDIDEPEDLPALPQWMEGSLC